VYVHRYWYQLIFNKEVYLITSLKNYYKARVYKIFYFKWAWIRILSHAIPTF